NVGGAQAIVRWSFVPEAAPTMVTVDALKQLGPDFLEQEIAQRVAHGPLHWEMLVTIAAAGDPTADPSKPWPATRRVVDVGTLIVKAVEPEPDGPCRDINYDPTVLPSGVTVSDDPFPAARSSVYRRSFDLRAA
ncbi:catalase, partial [Leclercia adecarboxylata]|nr:catalase [Leclercia adecarboxylata]